MKFRKILVASLLTILFLSLAGNIWFLNFGAEVMEVAEAVSDYIPIKWALIVLGEFDYYKHPPGFNAIQKVEHWIQSEGVPYDIIEDNNIEAPIDTPASSKYPLQYANGTIRYGVFVIINHYLDTSAVNINYIYWAVGNGTNAIIFGTAAEYVPALLDIFSDDVSYIEDYSINGINCTIHKTFSDGIIEYQQGTNQTIDNHYFLHGNVSDIEGKTVWYTMHSNTGKNWIGMMNTTYGSGKVFWSTVIPCHDKFFWYSTLSTYWETRNLKFVAHAINFMFKQVKKIDISLQGYKRWKGAITYRLDQDYALGIAKPPEEAPKAGWYVDVVICPLGYLTTGGQLTNGTPEGYKGAPNTTKVKYGIWSYLVVSTEPFRQTSRTCIVYGNSFDGKYTRVKVDWNMNYDFSDDPVFEIWENMTSNITGLTGTYYWCYIDNWTDPTVIGLGWWCPLTERISDFTDFKLLGEKGYVRYGFHGWQHKDAGNVTIGSVYTYWNGLEFVNNQTWIEQKFTDAKNELAYCLGGSGYGFDANKVLVSHPGNTYLPEVDYVLYNLDWVYLTYGDNRKNEPGWFLYADRKPAMTCGGGGENPEIPWRFEALKDAVRTLFPTFGIYSHNWGTYNLTFNVSPARTAYTDMFCFAHLDESFEFWFNARYMLINTVNAYYKNNKIVLEYKANSTLRDYVWKFPVEFNGMYFTGFSDNRTIGKIKHIDGKYVYTEFSEGGNEKIDAIYRSNPHIHQISEYVENITQTYTAKNLRLQFWNHSGTIAVEINCTRLGQPSLVEIDETLIDFHYDSNTGICLFNITFNGFRTVDITWEYSPPDSPKLVSPDPTSRFDPDRLLNFTWEFNDSDIGDSQSAYRFQLAQDHDFTSVIIDTGKVQSSSMQTTQNLPSDVALYYWRVKTWDGRNSEGEWSTPQSVIVDRLVISLKGATNDRTDIAVSTTVYFRVVREFDNAIFDDTKGAVYINGSTTTWDETSKFWKISIIQNSVGECGYRISSVTDTEYHITTINDVTGEQRITWDKLIVTIVPDSTTVPVNTQVHFEVRAIYAYDNELVSKFSASILRNGAYFATNNFTDMGTTPCTHQYAVESIEEDAYGLTVFSANSPTVTWAPKPLAQLFIEWVVSNALILIAIAQFAIVITFVFFRERKKRESA